MKQGVLEMMAGVLEATIKLETAACWNLSSDGFNLTAVKNETSVCGG